MRIILVSVYRERKAASILYALLESRVKNLEMNISHKAMPSMREHVEFLRSKPYRSWCIIKADGKAAGTIYATRLNEIGIHLFPEYHGKGIGRKALEAFMRVRKPLQAIPARRIGAWLANVSPKNLRSIDFFEKAGFTLKSYTLQR